MAAKVGNDPGNGLKNGIQPGQGWGIAVFVAIIGAFMSMLDASIVNVAIPTIMHVFNADTGSIQWVATIYLLALGTVVPLSGWMGDRLGFKRLYIISLAVFTLGSLCCMLSWSVTSLIVARVLQAVGGGMIMPTTMSMITRIVPKDRFGSAMGFFGIALMMAPAIGPTLGGYLVEYVDWRWIFTINLPVGAIGIFLSFFFLPEFESKKAEKLDLAGAVFSSTMLFSILLALSEGEDWGWTSEAIVLLLFASFILFILFIVTELTVKNPLLDLRIFRYRTFTMANLMSVVTNIGLYAGIFYIPLFLQNIRGLGAMETGLLMMPGALVSGVMMPVTGKLYDRIGPMPMAVTGSICVAVTTYLFHNIDINTPTPAIITWMMIRGAGMAFAMMPAQSASVGAVPVEVVGRASAISNIVGRVASAFGLAVLTSILNTRMGFHTMLMTSQAGMSNLGTGSFFQRVAAYLGGGTPGLQQAKVLGAAYLKGLISQAAFVKGIDDIFLIASFIMISGVLPAFFLKKHDAKAGSITTME